jgi:hypothetical protein
MEKKHSLEEDGLMGKGNRREREFSISSFSVFLFRRFSYIGMTRKGKLRKG